MATKIQIPSTGNAQTQKLKGGTQVFWAANGQNSYSVSLPAGAFVEFPLGGSINALNGGNTQNVTLNTVTSQTTVHCTFTKINTTAAAGGGGGATMTASASTQSGQSDIIVDP